MDDTSIVSSLYGHPHSSFSPTALVVSPIYTPPPPGGGTHKALVGGCLLETIQLWAQFPVQYTHPKWQTYTGCAGSSARLHGQRPDSLLQEAAMTKAMPSVVHYVVILVSSQLEQSQPRTNG